MTMPQSASSSCSVRCEAELADRCEQAALLAGTDVHLRDKWGYTALHWAASRGHEAVTAVLLSKKVSSRNQAPSHLRSSVGVDVVLPAAMSATGIPVGFMSGNVSAVRSSNTTFQSAKSRRTITLHAATDPARQKHSSGAPGCRRTGSCVLQANPALLSAESFGHLPVTAADLAAANGHSGLAAFLGESLLNELLANLKIENRRLDGASRCTSCSSSDDRLDDRAHACHRQGTSPRW